MSKSTLRKQLCFMISTLCLAIAAITVSAQTTAIAEEDAAVENVAVEKAVIENQALKLEDKKVPVPTAAGTKKMVQNATINLQTTVTGNQEQPRVLYILPWQSPAPEDVDFESLSNDQRIVFGHVEREELRRELESASDE